jgi:NitT/TauT family transport system substrate-binding protein
MNGFCGGAQYTHSRVAIPVPDLAAYDSRMRMRLVLVLVLTTATAAACGAASSTPTETPISVDVSLGDVSINKVPFLVAADAGLYAKHGLDVHQFITPGAAADARNSGIIVPETYVRQDISAAPIAVGGGAPMIYRAVNSGGLHRVIIATHEGVAKSHIIGPPSLGSAAALKGKRIGYSGTGTVTHFGLLSFVRKMGWDPQHDVTLVEGASSLNAIADGKVDAAMASVMLVALAPTRGLREIVDLGEHQFPLAGSGIMAERAWLAANRETAVRFVRAAVDAVALMKRDPAVVNMALAKWFNITDAVTQEGMYTVVAALPDKPYPSVAGIEAMMALYDTPAMRTRRAEEFYDATIVGDLDRSGYLGTARR